MNQLVLPLCPSMNVYWRKYHGVIVLSRDARDFKQHTAIIAKSENLPPPTNDEVEVEIIYHPKNRKKETKNPLRRRDVDNLIKPVLDALIGVAYEDDYQVVDVRCRLGDPVTDGKLVVSWRKCK